MSEHRKIQDFLDGNQNMVFANPAIPCAETELLEALANHREQALFRTSGTGGSPKWACLSKRALLAAANGVNAHLGFADGDVALRALPVFHVGGFCMDVRASVGGYRLCEFEGRWEPRRFSDRVKETAATVTSLVPTQLYDIVDAGLKSPASLRAVVVGGAALGDEVKRRALELGWPVLCSYGMTETCSQVATQTSVESGLTMLEIWEGDCDGEQCLSVRGAALFSGYIAEGAEGLRFEGASIAEGNWFQTHDRCELVGRDLRPIGRRDNVVKIRGELVDLDEVRTWWDTALGNGVAVCVKRDERAGYVLIVVVENATEERIIARAIARYEARFPAFQRIAEVVRVAALPQTSIGKIDYSQLEDLVVNRG